MFEEFLRFILPQRCWTAINSTETKFRHEKALALCKARASGQRGSAMGWTMVWSSAVDIDELLSTPLSYGGISVFWVPADRHCYHCRSVASRQLYISPNANRSPSLYGYCLDLIFHSVCD